VPLVINQTERLLPIYPSLRWLRSAQRKTACASFGKFLPCRILPKTRSQTGLTLGEPVSTPLPQGSSEVVIMVAVCDRIDGWVGPESTRDDYNEPGRACKAFFQRERNGAFPLGAHAEVFVNTPLTEPTPS
jgi:hypothetical protein